MNDSITPPELKSNQVDDNVQHQEDARWYIIHSDYMFITGYWGCAAALLFLFEGLHNTAISDDISLWHPATINDLQRQLVYQFNKDAIYKALTFIQDEGYISIQGIPDFEIEFYISFNPSAVNSAIKNPDMKRRSRTLSRERNKRVKETIKKKRDAWVASIPKNEQPSSSKKSMMDAFKQTLKESGKLPKKS